MSAFLDLLASKDSVIIGHRGARGLAPENTLASIHVAHQLGAQAVEIDVQSTRDGVLVVVHDDDLVRCSDVRARFRDRSRVADLTSAEIASLDAASWFEAERQALSVEERALYDPASIAPADRAVPTFASVLSFAHRVGLLVDVEIKALPRRPTRALLDQALDEIEELEMIERVLLTCFDHEVVHRAKQRIATLATGALFADRPHDAPRYVRDVIGADCVLPGASGPYDTIGDLDDPDLASAFAQLSRDAEERGLHVVPWVVNDAARAHRLEALGASAICTDFPNRL